MCPMLFWTSALLQGGLSVTTQPARALILYTYFLHTNYFSYGVGYPCTIPVCYYRGADKFLARPGRKQATVTEYFDVHISYLLS
jgi:hypothetical protein